MKRDLRENLLKYNDYELLYMNGLSSEEARDILFEKYMFMIKKMIVKFNVQPNEKDDYFQEGLIALNKAIKTYKETSNMTFTRFVEMLIYHRFVDLTRIKKKRNEENVSLDVIDYIIPEPKPTPMLYEGNVFELLKLSKRERQVYELIYNQGKTNKEVSEILGMKITQVYSTTDRIRKKNVHISWLKDLNTVNIFAILQFYS